MPGFFQGQHAQPTTLGHELAGWAAVLARDFERLIQAYRRINLSPAGAAIMTGSIFAIDRARTAELLGFDRPLANTFDAIMSHDSLLDSLSALAILNADLARLVDDLLLWDSTELGFVDIPDRFCGTSSILMQTGDRPDGRAVGERHGGRGRTELVTRVGHVSLLVPDVDAQAAFLQEVLGLREVERSNGPSALCGPSTSP